jgi:hypothetical protein
MVQSGLANNSSIEKYGIITSYNYTSTDIYVNIFLGTNFGYATKEILNIYTSNNKYPSGFSTNSDDWSVLYYSLNNDMTPSIAPDNDIPINFSGMNFTVPIGSWDCDYKMNIQCTSNVVGLIQLGYGVSTTLQNGDQDWDKTSYFGYYNYYNKNSTNITGSLTNFFEINNNTNLLYYVIMWSYSSYTGLGAFGFYSDQQKNYSVSFRARSAYL